MQTGALRMYFYACVTLDAEVPAKFLCKLLVSQLHLCKSEKYTKQNGDGLPTDSGNNIILRVKVIKDFERLPESF